MLLITWQESEEPQVRELIVAVGQTEHDASEEVKPANDMGTKDMEVTLSQAASTMISHLQAARMVSLSTPPEDEVRNIE